MKKIWMIKQCARKIKAKKWSEPIPLYAYSNKEKAKLDINYTRGIEKSYYLEYKHIITEYNLYDE